MVSATTFFNGQLLNGNLTNYKYLTGQVVQNRAVRELELHTNLHSVTMESVTGKSKLKGKKKEKKSIYLTYGLW